jgi:hypothetical protein
LVGAGCVYLIVTRGGSQERAILLALGGGLVGLGLGFMGALFPGYPWVGPLRPRNRYDLHYLSGSLAVIGLVAGFVLGARMDHGRDMMFQKALAQYNDPSEQARNTLDEKFLLRLPPKERAAAERGQQQFIRREAAGYLLYFAAGSVSALVLGSLLGRELGKAVGEFVEVAGRRRK